MHSSFLHGHEKINTRQTIFKILFAISSFIVMNSWVYATPLDFALYFGEVDEFKFIEVGKNANFDTDEITIEAWIKPTSLPTGTHVREGRSTIIWNGDQASGKDPYIFYINEFGELEAHVDFENGAGLYIINDSNPLVLDVWHHVALIINDNFIALAPMATSKYPTCGRVKIPRRQVEVVY